MSILSNINTILHCLDIIFQKIKKFILFSMAKVWCGTIIYANGHIFPIKLTIILKKHLYWMELINTYVTWSREISHLSKISIAIFLHRFIITSICFILMQTPVQLDIWLQSYETWNNIKQRNLNTVFDNTSKTIWPTSDSFLLIMSHIQSK